MNRCLLMICVSLAALAAHGCSAVDTMPAVEAPGEQSSAAGLRRLTIDDVNEGEVVETRPTDKAWLRLPWTVPLLRRDLVDAWQVIQSSERVGAPALTLFIDGRSGVLRTRLGDYRFHVGEVKDASGMYRVSIDPEGELDGRETMHWSLPSEAGRQLVRLLDERLAANGPLAKRRGYVAKRR